MLNLLADFRDDGAGATAIEYGLIAALMCVAVIAAIGAFSPSLTTAFTNIGTLLTTKTTF